MTATTGWKDTMARVGAALLAAATPLLALAQAPQAGAPNAEPMRGGGGVPWLWALVVIVALAILFAGVRGFYMRRRGPHGPQEPTPRGP